jgi:hypothetical protein
MISEQLADWARSRGFSEEQINSGGDGGSSFVQKAPIVSFVQNPDQITPHSTIVNEGIIVPFGHPSQRFIPLPQTESIDNIIDNRSIIEPVDNIQFPQPVWGHQYHQTGIPPRKEALIGGVLRRSHKLLIGAPSKAAKSFFAIRLAICIASGIDFLGFPCSKNNVYLVNFEIDEGSYMHRVNAVASAMGVNLPENIAYHHLRGYVQEIEILLPMLTKQIDNAGCNFGAIVLDPQYKLMRSSVMRNFSENSTDCLAYLYGELDRAFALRDISTIIVSHFAKGSPGAKNSIDRIAGSGLMARDVDALITLTPLQVDNAYSMEFHLRDFAPTDSFGVKWVYPLHQRVNDVNINNFKIPGRPSADPDEDDDIVYNKIVEMPDSSQSAIIMALRNTMSKTRVVPSLDRLEEINRIKKSGNINRFLYNIDTN